MHDNIVHCYGACFKDSSLYLVVERAQCNLEKYLSDQGGDVSDEVVWRLLHDIVRGLTFLCTRALYHRDLNPNNILVLTFHLSGC